MKGRTCLSERGAQKSGAQERGRQISRTGEQSAKHSNGLFRMSDEGSKANKNPVLVMIDESFGDRDARATGQKSVGNDREMDWLVKDIAKSAGEIVDHGAERIIRKVSQWQDHTRSTSEGRKPEQRPWEKQERHFVNTQ